MAEGSTCNVQLEVDANGWTVFSAPTVGNIFYISTNDGHDSNNGRSSVPNPSNAGGARAAGPWKTIAKAVTQAKADTGKDDWFLFKKGDTFLYQSIGFVAANGKDCAHPMVWGSYEPSQPAVVNPYGNFAISSMSWSGGVVTVTTATAHGWTKAKPYQIVISGALPGDYNGEFAATITGANALTFSFPSDPGAMMVPGIVTTGRPLIIPDITSQHTCLANDAGSAVGDFFAFVGLHCYAATRDPSNALYDKTTAWRDSYGILSHSPHVWRLLEDTKIDYMKNAGTTHDVTSSTSGFLIMRRNVQAYQYQTANPNNGAIGFTGGNYVNGAQHVWLYQNFNLFNGWMPSLIAGQSVSVNTSTSTITWPSNPLLNGSLVRFTGSPLPSGIVGDVTYRVVNQIGDNFQITASNTFNGKPIALGGTPVAIIGYAQDMQPTVFTHDYYLQMALGSPKTLDIDLTENILAFAGGTSCECGNGGTAFNNIFLQSPDNLIAGKGTPPAWTTNLQWNVSYNGFYEMSPQYSTPTPVAHGAAFGIASDTGPVLFSNNLVANAIGGVGTAVYMVFNLNEKSVANNTVCGSAVPIQNLNGRIITLSNVVSGSGYAPPSTPFRYTGQSQYQIQLTGGHGKYTFGAITVDPIIGQVTEFAANNSSPQRASASRGYRVGDVLSIPNDLIGGVGSGASITVTSVDSRGSITGWSLQGGSGYVGAYSVHQTSTSGTGSGMLFDLAVNSSGVVTAINTHDQFVGNAYAVNDTVSFDTRGGTGARATVSSVTTNIVSGNTTQMSNCLGLGPAGANPPTDIIGKYFQSIGGYTKPVPSVLVSRSSAYEQGFLFAASHQQKGNWDPRLTAGAVNAYARPLFNMTNPPRQIPYRLKRVFEPRAND